MYLSGRYRVGVGPGEKRYGPATDVAGPYTLRRVVVYLL